MLISKVNFLGMQSNTFRQNNLEKGQSSPQMQDSVSFGMKNICPDVLAQGMSVPRTKEHVRLSNELMSSIEKLFEKGGKSIEEFYDEGSIVLTRSGQNHYFLVVKDNGKMQGSSININNGLMRLDKFNFDEKGNVIIPKDFMQKFNTKKQKEASIKIVQDAIDKLAVM